MSDPTLVNEDIIWTALPNGFAGEGNERKLRLTVLVSPRLKSGTTRPPFNRLTLDLFPDFIDWPLTLKSIKFTVHIGATSFVENNGVTRAQAADSELWRALFKRDTFVRAHTFDDYSDWSIHSYPVMNVLGFIKNQYTKIGMAPPFNLPLITALNADDSFSQIAIKKRDVLRKMLRAQVAEATFHALPPSTPKFPDDFVQVDLFHATNQPARRRGPVALPEIDFHQLVSLLGEYPEVLRLMGLAVDFTIGFPVGASASGELSVEPVWTPAVPAVTVTPRTVLDANGLFIAAPRDPLATDFRRFLELRSDKFDVVQVDVDGAAIKAMNFATMLAQVTEIKTDDTPTVASVPSLRSGGLSIVRTGRAEALGNKFQRASKLNTDATVNAVSLFAEDILRGFRVDVREMTDGVAGQWFSLCRRVAVHNFTDINRTVVFDDVEGIASMGVMRKPQTFGEDSRDLLLHESMFRWAGWSLCVAPPIESVPPDRTLAPTTGSKPPFGLKSSFTVVPDSLPVLRFGRVYQFRVRTVDLVGNSNDLSSGTDDATVTNAGDGFYARFEPVSAPVIVPRNDVALSPGESVERLVVRSNEGVTPEEYLTTLPRFEVNASGEPGASPEFRAADYHAASERHIAPPKIGADTAETSGMFDAMSTGEITDAKKRTDNVPKIEPGEELNSSYLPDPLAAGACFFLLPGTKLKSPIPTSSSALPQFVADTVTQVSFTLPGDRWPDTRTFRLRLIGINQDAEPAQPDFNSESRVLTVEVPQAEVLRFRLSSFFATSSRLELMGIWRWIEEGIENLPSPVLAKTEQLIVTRGLALNGLHWMLTPFREIVLVHAVQQPLLKPDFHELTSHKFFGATFAKFEGEIRCDGKSTGKLDVLADWQEAVDDPTDPAGPHCPAGPQTPIRHQAHAFSFPLNFKGAIAADAPIELIDSSRPIAEYDHRRRLLSFTNKITGENLPRHDFGDTKHRLVAYTAVASTRFREYFHQAITDDEENITRRSSQALRHILSSARPDAPKVLYVVPTFGWERSPREGAVIKSARRGGGLRVYMDRPWFSSGDGEMLGVVLWTGRLPEDPDQLSRTKPYITRWGLDPIWSQTSLSPNLDPQNFKRAKVLDPAESKTTGLTLEELDDPTLDFSVAPHEVAYDEVRRLWFCDIEIEPGVAYFPFVRLALARYQPHSVDDVYLSRVVLADFAQLTPDRSASVTFGEAGQIQITVSGEAFPESTEGGGNRVTATVQERTNVDPDLGWTDVANLSVLLRRHRVEVLNFWTGALSVPENREPGANRLLIQEWEIYTSDALQPGTEGTAFRERLVYAEALPL